MINLSHRKLSETEVVLLSKGLKITPTPKFGNKEELIEDLHEFHRKLRLALYFDDTENEDISLVRNKSKFVPPPTDKRNIVLDDFINAVENFPKSSCRTLVVKQNLTQSEREAIKSLKEDNSIIIKEADKGGVSDIMDKEDKEQC